MTDDVGIAWLDSAIQYAKDVRSGQQVACKYVQLAVDRWFRDLETAHQRGLYFDELSVCKYFRFIYRYCTHSEGEWEGQPVVYEPWQCFAEANIHGWKWEKDHTRRFRIVYEECGRKNGKTLRMASNGNFYMVADGEPGPQVYSAATKRDQAREIFDGSLAMVRSSPGLREHLIAEEHKIKLKKGRGRYVPLSKDSKRMDGFNVHAGLIDELHAHESPALYNVIRSGTAARKQPIIRSITTAGFDRKSFCFSRRQYAIKVLEQTVENDAFFAIIYTLDDPEKWNDPKEWIKANPNLGVSLKTEQLLEQAREAEEIPDQKVEFLTKRMNIWTYGAVAWMPMDVWHDCRNDALDGVSPFAELYAGDLLGRECFGGLDLASVEDMCSLSFVFPDGEKRTVISRSYLPQAALERRLKDGDPTLEKFKDSGHLVVIPGEVVEYDIIEHDIRRACEIFDVGGIAFDRFNSTQLVTNLLDDEIPMVKFGQGTGSMNAPTKELMRLALKRDIEHNDPLLSWAMSNVVVKRNPAGDIKPDKSQVSEKIDPAVATIMGIGLAMAPVDEQEYESIYNKGEL